MWHIIYENVYKSMNTSNERFNNQQPMTMMFMALLMTILLSILILYIGKLLWNCCLTKNVQGVKPLDSWVDLLGIYILVRILICK